MFLKGVVIDVCWSVEIDMAVFQVLNDGVKQVMQGFFICLCGLWGVLGVNGILVGFFIVKVGIVLVYFGLKGLKNFCVVVFNIWFEVVCLNVDQKEYQESFFVYNFVYFR